MIEYFQMNSINGIMLSNAKEAIENMIDHCNEIRRFVDLPINYGANL